MIGQLRDEGVTVFLTTHYLEEAERLCDTVALLAKGRIVALDTVAQLKAQVQGAASVEITLERGDGAGKDQPSEEPEVRRLSGSRVEDLLTRALNEAQTEGYRVVAVNTVEPSLEDVFVQLTTESSTGLDEVSGPSLDEVSGPSLDEVSGPSLDEVSDPSLDEVSDRCPPKEA